MVKQSEKQKIDVTCIQKSDNQIEIQNNIVKNLETMLKEKTEGLNFLNFNVNANEIIQQKMLNVSNSVDFQIVNECLTALSQNQEINVKRVGGDVNILDIDQNMLLDTVVSCTQKQKALLDEVNDFTDTVNNTIDTETVGLTTSGLWAIAIGLGIFNWKQSQIKS